MIVVIDINIVFNFNKQYLLRWLKPEGMFDSCYIV